MDDEKSLFVRAAAIGLGAAGVAALVVAWVLGDDFAEPTPGPWWTRVGTVVLVLVLAGLLWTRRQVLVLVAAVVALAVTVLAVLGFLDQGSRGFPGVATVLTALGGFAVTVAAVLVLRFPAERGRLPALVPAAVGFVLVPAMAVPLVMGAPTLRVEATTAEAGNAPTVPAAVHKVAWSTEIEGPVRDVVPAGAGVVVLLDDGVVALDGQTGEVRWRRARHGAEAEQVDASPDGRTVVVQFSPRDLFPISREIIDAFTGKVRFTVDSANEGRSPGFITPVTDTSYIGATDDEQEFFGNSLTDGHRLWTYRPPRDCWLMTARDAQMAVGNGMMLPLACGDREDNVFDEFRYVLVDGKTGDLWWEHQVQLPEPTGSFDVDAQLAPDGRFVTLGISGDAFMSEGTYVVLDTATGQAFRPAEKVELLAGGVAVAWTADASRLVDVISGKTVSTSEEVRACASTNHGAFLAAGVVCVDPALDSFEDFVSTGRIQLGVGTYQSPDLDLVEVTLGSSLDRSSDSDEIEMVVAPGAVVVSTPMTPENGGPVQLVGLR